ncbi:hypothetical protein MC885_017502, partial [Smutsia gigantea]
VNPYCTDFPGTTKTAVPHDRQPYSLCSNRKCLSQQLDCPAGKAVAGVCCSSPLGPSCPHPGALLQGTSRPTRSLSTAQLAQPSGGLQASVISNIVLMKGQAKGSPNKISPDRLPGIPKTISPVTSQGYPKMMSPVASQGSPNKISPDRLPGIPNKISPDRLPGIPNKISPDRLPGIPNKISPDRLPGIPQQDQP